MACNLTGTVGTCAETSPGACGIVCDSIPEFQNSEAIDTGANAAKIAIADFNGDGKQDVAFSYNSGNTITVHLANGNGTFAPKVAYPVGYSAAAIRAVDLSGDGKPDLAVLTSSTLSVLRNNGNGTFAAKVDFATLNFSVAMTAADLNGDGWQDIAIATSNYNLMNVFMNNGSGGFGPRIDYTTPASPTGIAAADLNGDGKPELAVTTWYPGTLSVYPNSGNGSFGAKVDYPISDYPNVVEAADVNGDGKQDFIAGSPNKLNVLVSNGNGTLAAKVDYGTGQIQGISAGDLNGDGKNDIVVTNSTLRSIGILLNNGNGTFGTQMDFGLNREATAVAMGELTGDGKLDVVAANGHSDGARLFVNKGDGRFWGWRNYGVDVHSYGDTKAADLNGDNHPDLIATTGTYYDVFVYMNNGKGTVSPHAAYNLSGGGATILTPDIDADGDLDMIVANSISWGNMITTFKNNGNGTFAPKVDYMIANPASDVAVIKLNGDTFPDLAVTFSNSFNGRVETYVNNGGTGSFSLLNSYPVGRSPGAIVASDLNGDGNPDLATVNADSANSTVDVLLNNGNGTFASRVTYQAGINPTDIIAADLTGDGYPDLAVTNRSSNTVSVLVNHGNGTFASKVDYAVGTVPRGLAAVDLTGDGKLELLVANAGVTAGPQFGNSDSVSILVKDDTGTFAPKFDYYLGNAVPLVLGTDMNGDGKADLVVTNESSQGFMLSVMLNDTVNACYP